MIDRGRSTVYGLLLQINTIYFSKFMFITLEGPEGSGKTSHIPHLVEYLREQGHIVFPTREPGGTSISEQIRDILHDMKNAEMHPRTETLLYQSARAQSVEQVIKPRLDDGEIVISDSFYFILYFYFF